MELRAHHLHLFVAGCFALGALAAIYHTNYFLAFFLLAGGVVALAHWKAAKSGLIDI